MAAPKDMGKVQEYQKASGPIMVRHGAVMPAIKMKVEQVLVGAINPVFIMQVEFPSKESINSAFADPEYLNLINDRDKGFSELNIFITSV